MSMSPEQLAITIAAHAAETGRLILSRDARARFGDLPGITAADA